MSGQRHTMKALQSCDQSYGVPIEGIVYHCKHFEDGGIDLNEADDRYVNITGDTMEGHLNMDFNAIQNVGDLNI